MAVCCAKTFVLQCQEYQIDQGVDGDKLWAVMKSVRGSKNNTRGLVQVGPVLLRREGKHFSLYMYKLVNTNKKHAAATEAKEILQHFNLE